MSAKATFWAWKQELSHTKKIVLLALANYANENDESWHGMDSLAKTCGLTKRSIINQLKALEEDGYLIIIKRKKTGILNDTNLYRLNITSESLSSGQVNHVHHPSERDSPPLVKDVHHPSERDSPKSKSKSKIESESKTKKEIPSFVDQQLFDSYFAWRKKSKLSVSQTVHNRIVNKLNEIEAAQAGAANEALSKAEANGWKDIYPPNNQNMNTGKNGPNFRSVSNADRIDEMLARREKTANSAEFAPSSNPFSDFSQGVTIDG